MVLAIATVVHVTPSSPTATVDRTRHARLTIHSTWGSPTVPAYYNKLAIDEIYVVRRDVR